jgi:hypothetical protein
MFTCAGRTYAELSDTLDLIQRKTPRGPTASAGVVTIAEVCTTENSWSERCGKPRGCLTCTLGVCWMSSFRQQPTTWPTTGISVRDQRECLRMPVPRGLKSIELASQLTPFPGGRTPCTVQHSRPKPRAHTPHLEFSLLFVFSIQYPFFDTNGNASGHWYMGDKVVRPHLLALTCPSRHPSKTLVFAVTPGGSWVDNSYPLRRGSLGRRD